jgi:glutamate-1-semialdehyde 2,1-aminomutase
MGVGTNSLGYSDPDVNSRVISAIEHSTTSSLNSILEVELAERLISISPGMDMAKFAKTGADANSIALRIARSYNGKEGVALCGYHGWHDWYLSANLSDGNKLNNHLFPGVQLSGVPESMSGSIHAFEYNDILRLKTILETESISCVIMEVQRNVPPSDNFLEQVRELCTKENVVLIFDECSSGFRETFGGLYKKYDVIPDMVMFGKAMTNGFPLTAVLGKREIMRCAENTFISSTYFSEATGYAAGIATLEKMEKLKSWEITKENGLIFKRLWTKVLNESGLKYDIVGLDAMPKFHIDSIDFKTFVEYLASSMLDANILAYETIYPCIYHNHEETSFKKYSEVFEETVSYLVNNIDKFQSNTNREIGMKRLN